MRRQAAAASEIVRRLPAKTRMNTKANRESTTTIKVLPDWRDDLEVGRGNVAADVAVVVTVTITFDGLEPLSVTES
jgi:hypothetical protein